MVDYKKLLTFPFEANEIWVDLFDAVSKVLDRNVHKPKNQLKNIRDPENLKRLYLILNAKHIGFDFLSDKLTTEDYDRIYRYASLYWPENGTQQLSNFIGFIKNMRLELNQLWSNHPEFENSYGDFSTYPGTPVWKNGEWFPTSHYELQFDALNFSLDERDIKDLIELFYLFAPVHLVLERFNKFIYSRGKLSSYGSVFVNYEYHIQSPQYDRETNFKTNLYVDPNVFVEHEYFLSNPCELENKRFETCQNLGFGSNVFVEHKYFSSNPCELENKRFETCQTLGFGSNVFVEHEYFLSNPCELENKRFETCQTLGFGSNVFVEHKYLSSNPCELENNREKSNQILKFNPNFVIKDLYYVSN